MTLINTTVYTPGIIIDKVVASNFDIILIIMINNATQADLEYWPSATNHLKAAQEPVVQNNIQPVTSVLC